MTWLQTYTGRAFFTDAPNPADVRITDIAHALSNLCRFGGHVNKFYSVAEHSVHVSYLVPEKYALTALLHDATEAYIVDLPRPIKQQLPDYKRLEDRVWQAIAARFGLCTEQPECVKHADNAMLLAERDQLLGPVPIPWTWAAALTPADRVCLGLSPIAAKRMFLDRFKVLTAKSSGEH